MSRVYDLLRLRCGLSQAEAADFHGTRLDTIKSWCSDRRSAPPGALDELKDLYGWIVGYAARVRASVENSKKEIDGTVTYSIGLPTSDPDAKRLGLPTVSAWQAVAGLVIADLPQGSKVILS